MMRDHFLLPANQIYLCGHSLGPTPKTALYKIDNVLQDWASQAVKAWNTSGWFELSTSIAEKIAPLIGASSSEVVVCDSTSVNLFKVLMSALKLNQPRKTILTTKDNFPADLYIAQGIVAFRNELNVKTVNSSELYEHLNETVAVLMLTHVSYRDARIYDMAEITRRAHQLGILVVWDLSHSVGAVPVDLTACNADFAVGCTYKYLNGGPGSPAFVYVNARHDNTLSPIYGWMGHQQPFAFDLTYKAIGAAKYLGGTPPILSCKALEGALEVFNSVDIQTLYQLSQQHSLFLMESLQRLGLELLISTDEPRGGHVAFIHQQGYALSRALIDHGVIGDYREPGLIRLCVNPLYLSMDDIKQCVERLQHVLEKQLYLSPQYQQILKVT